MCDAGGGNEWDHERRLVALHEATREMMAADSTMDVCDIAVEAACGVLDFDVNGIWLHDEESGRLEPATQSEGSRELFGPPENLPRYTPESGSISWRVFETGEPVSYGDVGDAEEIANPDTAVRSELVLPLGRHGVMNIGSTTANAFDDTDEHPANLLAANTEAALDAKGREQDLERYEQMLSIAGDGVYAVDTERTIRQVNDQVAEMTGYSRGELVGSEVSLVLDESDIRKGERAVEKLVGSDREVATFEQTVHRADGSTFPAEARVTLAREDGEVTGTVGVVRDITERKRAERQLRANVDDLEMLYRVTTDSDLDFEAKVDRLLELGCRRLDLPFGFVSRIDDGIQEIRAARGSHPLLQTGEVCPLSEAYCRKTIRSEGLLAVHDAIERGWADDPAYDAFGLGSYIGAKVVVDDEVYGTLCFADEEPHGEAFTDADRTFVELHAQWVGYEIRQRCATEMLERQNERLGEFASMVSHDLRNPLSIAKGNLGFAREEHDSEELRRIEGALERMEDLIEDVLALAREGDVDELQSVGLVEVVQAVWESVGADTASLAVEEDLGTVRADERRLRQLFENLLRNAVEHGGENVTVRVGTTEAGDGFYVADDGPGIPADEREAVFESGYSTSHDGTGFGLTIVATIADAHGWSVSVTESEAGGARFDVAGIHRAPASTTATAGNTD